MSTDNITPQTGVAGEDTTDLVTDEDATVSEDRGDSDFYLHIITSHIHCGGIVSLVDGECDEDDLCGKLTTLPSLVPCRLPSSLTESTTLGSVT